MEDEDIKNNLKENLGTVEDVVAARLVAKVNENQVPGTGESKPTVSVPRSDTSKADFVRLEKNLASLGFFTPSSKRIKSAKAKTITLKKTVNGTRVEARATIIPGALYGLPITADQDKFLALQKLIADVRRREGKIPNPIGFTSAELLALLKQHRRSGKNYKDVDAWLNVMVSTVVVSEGAVYLAGQKRWVKDRFHVFDRAVSFGKELEPGKVADRNYVWLSAWQLENLEANHLIPIDLETYRALRHHIAKSLAVLIQIWFHASQDAGVFEKRYEDLCEFLGIAQYRHPSDVIRQLRPSLEELKRYGYINEWTIAKTSQPRAYKMVLRHGEKFRRERAVRMQARESGHVGAAESAFGNRDEQGIVDDGLLGQLVRRGIREKQARRILARVAAGQDVGDQLEWADSLVEAGRIRNPPGFYVYVLTGNLPVPQGFEPSGKRRIREAADRTRRDERAQRIRLELAYSAYRGQVIDDHIGQTMGLCEYEGLIDAKAGELATRWQRAGGSAGRLVREIARHAVRSELARGQPILTFEQFCTSPEMLNDVDGRLDECEGAEGTGIPFPNAA
jgi:hypothetical protein